MGSVELRVPFRGGDLVFIAEKDDTHTYTCLCKMCNGMGSIDKPNGVKMARFDEEEGEFPEEEMDCPACDGYGGDDEEISVLFPSAIGRISRITMEHMVNLHAKADEYDGEEDDGEEEEITVEIELLTTAQIDALSLMGQTEQMMEFYRRLKNGTVTDFINTDRGETRTVDVDCVHKTFKQSCEYVLKENLRAFKQAHSDLTNSEFEFTDHEKLDLIHACNEIVAVQDMILNSYPDLERLVPGYKIKDKSNNKTKTDTAPAPQPKLDESIKAVLSLAKVEVEEALL